MTKNGEVREAYARFETFDGIKNVEELRQQREQREHMSRPMGSGERGQISTAKMHTYRCPPGGCS